MKAERLARALDDGAAREKLVTDYINALGPHMEEAWKERFVEVFCFEVDRSNPYEPVRARKERTP